MEGVAVDGLDGVAGAQAGLFRGRSRLHLLTPMGPGRYWGSMPASLRSKSSLLASAGTLQG